MFISGAEKNSLMTKPFPYHAELIPVETGSQLLGKPALQPSLKKLKALANQPKDHYQFFYYAALEKLAEWIQSLPSYKNKTFNHIGGMLDLAIARACLVLTQYRQQYPVHNISSKKMPLKLSLWSYALFTASIFYNIGYIATNFSICVCNKFGHKNTHWNPIQQAMLELNSHFRFSFINTNYDALAGRYTLLLAKHLLPAEGLAWIANDIEIMDYWLAILQDDERGGGIFAKQVMTAEESLLLQDLGLLQQVGIPTREQILEWHDHDRLQKYLEQPILEETHKEHSNTKPLVDKQGNTYLAVGINDRDVTGGQVIEIGERFISWLKNGIKGHTISVNRPESLIHIVHQGVLLKMPLLFQEFLKQNPTSQATWQEIVANLRKMDLVIAQISNLQSYASTQQNSTRFGIGEQQNDHHTGFLLIHSAPVFNQQVLPPVNADIKGLTYTNAPDFPTINASSTPNHTSTT